MRVPIPHIGLTVKHMYNSHIEQIQPKSIVTCVSMETVFISEAFAGSLLVANSEKRAIFYSAVNSKDFTVSTGRSAT